jgi:cell division protein FtsB
VNEESLGQDKKEKGIFGKLQVVPILIFLTLAYVAFLLYQAVSLNYQTNQKITSLKKEIKEVEQDRESLDALIAYYQTPAFQELEARKKLGMKMPGEKVVTVELTKTPVASKKQDPKEIETTGGVPNYQKWLDFICGKQG